MRPLPPLSGCLLAAILLSLAAAPTAAGVLRGRVSVGTTPQSNPTRVRDTILWLEQVPEKVEKELTRTPFRWFWQPPPPQPLPRLIQTGGHFQPHTLALAVGGALVIHNQDQVWHGTFSVSPARVFDLGKRPPGRADTVIFDTTGVVALRCDIHPDMSAFVIVTPNHASTRPDAAGDWRLPELPAGRYVLHAWHPDHEELRQVVNVPARGTVRVPIHF